MGDLHERVVDRIDQRVQRITATAGQGVVGHRAGRERRLAPDQVVPGDRLIGHPQPQHRPATLGAMCVALIVGEVPIEIVVTEFRVPPRGDVPRLHLLGCGVRLVHLARRHQPLDHVAVDVAALGLAIRAVWSADLGALVVVEAEPVQRVQQRQIALLAVAFGVGVLEPEHEVPAVVPRVRPIEQRGSDQTDVRCARRRRTEPHPHPVSCHDFPLRTTGLVSVPMPSIVMLTVSPFSSGPTPSGVPVRMRSPGRRVITAEIHSTTAPTS